GPGVLVDVRALGQVDVAGAFLIDRTIRGAGAFENSETPAQFIGAHDVLSRLIETARAAAQACPEPTPAKNDWTVLLERTGRAMIGFRDETLATLSFLGQNLVTLARLAGRPSRIRWPTVTRVMDDSGLDALPIIALLAFFIGVVIAYLGAR